MGGHQAGPQHAPVRRGGGGQDRVHIDPVVVQVLGHLQRPVHGVGEDGHDGGLALPDGQAPAGEGGAEVVAKVGEPRWQLRVLHKIPQGRQSRGAAGGGDGGGEDEGTGAVAHIVHHPFLGGHVSAQAGQRFGEGAHIHVHLILQVEIAGRAPAAFADGPKTVGIVHHDPGAVLLRQSDDVGQVRDVAAHAEHAVGDDQGPRGFGDLLQTPLQIRHVVVPVAEHLAEAEPGAVVDAGMVLPIQDHIVASAHQGGDDAQIGLEARGEGHDRLLAEEPGQLLFQLQMHGQRAVQKPGAGAARAEVLQSPDAGLHHFGAAGEAQIVVGPQHDPPPALHDDLWPLPGLQGAEIGIDALLPVFIRQGRGVTLCKQIHRRLPLMVQTF